MVFSFLKKTPGKKPDAAPLPKQKRETLVSPQQRDEEGKASHSKQKPDVASVPASDPAVLSENPNSNFSLEEQSDFVFSEVLGDFQLDAETDPVSSAAEEAAVLYANAQDTLVRAQLEQDVKNHRTGKGELLWLMLFDLYRQMGEKEAFESLGIEYAGAFEKSPPIWIGKQTTKPVKTKSVAASGILFKGEMLGENQAAFDSLRQAILKSPSIKLDVGRVKAIDLEGCRLFLELLELARSEKRGVELHGKDAFEELVQALVENGQSENPEYWLILFELYQQQGKQNEFEEMAINYAVSFEVSPPSWEQKKVAKPEPVKKKPVGNQEEEVLIKGAYVLQGDIKGARFEDLQAYVDKHRHVIIDCTYLARIDFVSAGALLNLLTSIQQTGKKIYFRHPSHLVAELFRVVGLMTVAKVVYAKN